MVTRTEKQLTREDQKRRRAQAKTFRQARDARVKERAKRRAPVIAEINALTICYRRLLARSNWQNAIKINRRPSGAMFPRPIHAVWILRLHDDIEGYRHDLFLDTKGAYRSQDGGWGSFPVQPLEWLLDEQLNALREVLKQRQFETS